jgi:hypothetical protein
MSQIFKPASSGPPPPGTVTDLSGQTGTNPVPPDGANNINVFAEDITDNVADGIQTRGDAATNTIYVQLTNRFQGTGTTVGATTADLFTFALGATPRTFVIDCNVAAFESTTPAGAGLSTYSTIITNGVAATVIDDTDAIAHMSPALAAINTEIIASGNNAIFRVTGVAGLTINWSTVGYYVRSP